MGDDEDDSYDDPRDEIVDMNAYRRSGDRKNLQQSVAIVLSNMRAPIAEVQPSEICITCRKPTTMPILNPNNGRRDICGSCQGKINRSVCDDMSAAVRTLKAGKNAQGYDRARKLLIEQGYQDTVDFLEKNASSPAKRGGFE